MGIINSRPSRQSNTEPARTRSTLSRRAFCQAAAGVAALPYLGTTLHGQLPRQDADSSYVAHRGRIRQSVMGWCFNKHMKPLELAKHCRALGIVGMEGIGAEHYPGIRKLGLEISLVGSHGFAAGPCNPKHTDEVVSKLNKAIDLAKSIGTKNVITFTGMRYPGMVDQQAKKRCMDTWKRVLPHAESAGVTLVLEHLNSRDDSHPMKGHPGYFGDDVDFCFDMIREIGSDHFKLLFDVYHVSVMNGDVIRRIRNNHELIGHYHTAGNPGRAELDNQQEINYPAIMREIVKTGYKGFVAQEFIPTWDDPVSALRHAVEVCDV